ncbi:MAG: ferredoxin [bacterium]|nr:ferredoxin [bacterium]
MASTQEQEETTMKYHVNENCIGCGMCESLCPEVFQLMPEGVAEAKDISVDLNCAKEAMNSCPVAAIEEE